jgi:hypothetical protein
MGFAAPANVAPARRLAAALAAAAIFRAVTEAGVANGVAAGADGAAAEGAGRLVALADDAGAKVSTAVVLVAGVETVNVPEPFVPSKRAGAPGSETPKSTSGSSSSPEGEFEAVNVGISAVSGRASDTGAEADSGDTSSKSPCESKSSPDSGEELFSVPNDGIAAMGSSTGRSARGSSLGREAASIVFEPESGRSILNVSCNAVAEVPRRWLTDRKWPSPQCDARHALRPVPIQLTHQKP